MINEYFARQQSSKEKERFRHDCVDGEYGGGGEVIGIFSCAIDVAYEGGGVDTRFPSSKSMVDDEYGGGGEGKKIICS